MKQQQENGTAFSEQAREELAGGLVEEAISGQADLIEQAQQTTPKGRRTKAAKDAEQVLQMQQLLQTSLQPVNQLLAAKVPEFAYTDEELAVLASLGGKVLSKYVDSAMLKYGDEIVLGTFLIASTANKTEAYLSRRKRENRPVSLKRFLRRFSHGTTTATTGQQGKVPQAEKEFYGSEQ